jgi:putative membrane protein
MRGVKISVQLALATGFAVMIALVAAEGAGTVVGLLSLAGWRLLLLVPLQVAPLLFDVLGWRALILARVRLDGLFLIACIRQAINRLLPVANVGGEIVGIRLLTQQGVASATASASVIVEVVLTLAAQYVFVVVGVVCLILQSKSAGALRGLMAGLGASLPPIILAIIILRHGRVFHRLDQLAVRFFGRWLDRQPSLDRGARLDERIRETLTSRARVSRAFSWQLAGLVVGCSETWLALRWLGHPVGIAAALILESLTLAARSVFFVIPAGLGVQEAGLIGAGLLVGVGIDAALALSLAKRMRELLFGLPALIAWQVIESRHVAVQLRNRE